MAPWLDNLPSHPIFTLPSDSTPATPTAKASSTSQLPPPASPGLSSIFPTPSSSSKLSSSLSQSTSSRSLFGLSTPTKPQSKRTQLSSSVAQRRIAQPELPPKDDGYRQSKMVLSRGTDLLVAVGKELRIASLGDVKSRSSGDNAAGESQNVELGEYKVLDVPAVDFEIQQLILNPTSKLLAVVGVHSIAVVVLPRKGWSSSLNRVISCRSLLVGKFYHALPGSLAVAQVLWHPWGEGASSLLVLTVDCLLREYSISVDVEEPAQTLSFSHSTPTSAARGSAPGTPRGGKRFSADDEGAEVATGMCIGEGEGDWGPLTIYGLMRNGDIYALSPFLPRRASIPPSYIHALSVFVASKVDYLALSSFSDPQADVSSSTSLLASTSTPTKANTLALTHKSSSTPTQRSEREDRDEQLSKIYNLQLLYVNSLVRQATHASSSSAQAATADPDSSMDLDAPAPSSTPVSIITPSNRPAPPALQGPFLLQPASEELETGVEEPRATDIAYFSYSGRETQSVEEEEAGKGEAIGVLATVWSDGRLDLMVEVEKVEGRFAVSRQEQRGGEGAPSLVVYETIDLGLAADIKPSPTPSADEEEIIDAALRTNYPTLARDPLYPDTLYVSHSLGAHCVGMGAWLEPLLAASKGAEEDEEAELERMEKALRGSEGSSVGWVLKTRPVGANDDDDEAPPVVGMSIINDIYLGYSLLLLTRQLQLVAIELSLRVDESLLPSSTTSDKALTSTADESAHPSLLSEPFTIPTFLSASRPQAATTALARLAPPKPASKELVITPETLRYLGKTVEVVQGGIRDLVDAADGVQLRLELQMKELGRQLRSVEELSALGGGGGSGTKNAQDPDLGTRLAQAQERQLDLLARTDKLLQQLMDAHSPTLSNFEKKWFGELERLRVEEGRLGERVKRVEGRAEELRPGLERLRMRSREESGGKTKKEEGTLGDGQVKKLESMLVQEAKLIAEARRKVDRLSHALASNSLS